MSEQVRTIVSGWLKDRGFSGLYNDVGECGCSVYDLMPCDGPCNQCEPAIKVYCPCCGEDLYISLRSLFQTCRSTDEKSVAKLADLFGILAGGNTETGPDDAGE